MAATVELKSYTGTAAATENPAGAGDVNNWNMLNTDAYDSDGVQYKTAANRITVPSSNTSYSYERWMRVKCTGAFNSITNVKYYRSAGSLSDAALDLVAGLTITATTPINTVSTLATSTAGQWDAVGEALDITPVAGEITTATTYSKYAIVQLVVPSTVTTPGDIGSQTITFSYDES